MSEPWQRLSPRAKLPLALVGSLRAFCASATERFLSFLESRGLNLAAERLRAGLHSGLRHQQPAPGAEPYHASSLEPGRALVVLAEGRKALLTLPARGRALVKRVPAPVQIELRKLSLRGAHVCREIFAGVLVVGLIAIVGGYGRLSRGPISLPSLVPAVEEAINGQLSDLRVKVDDAILQRSSDGPGVLFRLRNIRLIDTDGSIVAQAPLAAIGMSGAALLGGRIAPGSVDFIGPRLLVYSSDNGLSLSFYRPAGEGTETIVPRSAPDGAMVAPQPPEGAPGESVMAKRPELQTPLAPDASPGAQLDVTRTITEVFERARRGDSSYLTRFGVKDAQVVLSQDGVESLWQVPDFSIDLEHKDERSVLVGQANLGSTKGDWQLDFRTEQRPKRHSLSITALIQNLVPSGLAETISGVPILKALDLPVSGETSLELATSGRFLSGEADLELAQGHITPPWDPKNAMQIDSGNLHLKYFKRKRVVEIEPSTLAWGDSKATFSGSFRAVANDHGSPSWSFNLKADDATLAVEDWGLAPLKVDEWAAEGTVTPGAGRLTLSRFVIRSGTASIELAGNVIDAPGSPEMSLTGTVSPMPLDVLKQLWPKFLAGDARKWALQNVRGGRVLGGKIDVSLAPGELARIQAGAEPSPESVNVEVDYADLSINYIDKMPPILAGLAKTKVSGVTFAVDIPEAKVALPSGEEVALKDGRFFIPDLRLDPQQGEITFNADGATASVLKLLDHEPLGYMQTVGLKPDEFGGTAQGSFVINIPMREDLKFEHVKLRGAARLDQAIASNVLGDVDVEGGTLDVNVTEQGLDAHGGILIKGVPAQLSWQRIFDQPNDSQPPIKISTTLDEPAREALGLKVSHLVRGAVPVVLSVARHTDGTQNLSMQADLTQAQLVFGNMGWTKPPGRSATVQFDVVKATDGSTELQNFKILGDDITIDGQISLDPEQHLKSFYFSDFSFDILTHLEITATVRDGDVLEVDAHGPSYNGKQFFQSLFSAGQLAENADARDPFSVDMTARFGTVVGFYDTTLSDVKATLKKRNGRLVALDASGQLNGRGPVAVKLDDTKGTRVIRAETRDAGDAFRLIGFYPKVEGGEASLEVNLDAGQSGLKSGTLWARNFSVLGDSVVSDVLTDPQSQAALGAKRKDVRQSRIAFNQLRAPFAVGNGEFLLNDAYVNGPALGATMRGKVNFKTQTVNLGGTYVPLYGLNSALGNIPILGGIFVGREGEGVVGITFAVQGKLNDPNVLVNPMSVVAPGIFRQIFEFRGQNSAATSTVAPSSSDFAIPGQ
jgi:AsmA-like C-terminal region/Protein of unknown function